MKSKITNNAIHNMLYAVLALSLSSCIGDISNKTKDLNVNSNISLPLGSVNISDSTLLQSIGAENGIKIDDSGILTYQTSKNIELSDNNIITKVLDLPTQNLNFNEILPELSGLASGTVIPVSKLAPDGLNIKLKINSSNRLDTVIFTQGYIDLAIDNPNNYDYSNLIFTLENITRNEQPISLTNGQRIEFNDGATYVLSPSQGNMLDIQITGDIPYSYSLDGIINLDVLEITKIVGYFGRHELDPKNFDVEISGELDNFMKNIEDIYLSNPSISLSIDNSIDAPYILKLNTLEASLQNPDGSIETKQLIFRSNAGAIFINEIGLSVLEIDNNSFVDGQENLSDVISHKGFSGINLTSSIILNPTKEDLQDLGSEPLPSDQTTNRISLDQSSNAELLINIPLEGIFKGLNMSYDFDLDLSSIDKNYINMNEFAMGLWGTNNLPMDLSIIAQTREGDIESGMATDLFDQPIIIPGSNGLLPSDPLFRAGEIKADDLKIATMPSDKAQKILKAKKLFFKIKGSSFDSDKNNIVRICSPSDLELKIVMGANADIEISNINNSNE